jgi:anti-sigma B factor antagonist
MLSSIVDVMSNSCDASAEPPVVGAVFACVQDGPGLWHLFGELDADGVPELRDRLDGVEGDVTLDCSGLTFLASSGLALFVSIRQACQARGAKLMLVNPSRCVIRLLELTDLLTLLAVPTARPAL